MAGQTLVACGQPFMIQAPTKLASVWFGDSERTVATTIGSLAGPVGCIIGFVLPLFWLSEDPLSPAQTRSEMYDYIFYQSIVVTAMAAPILFLIRNKPPFSPSLTAFEGALNSQNTFRNFGLLLKDWNYIFIVISFSFSFSIYGALASVLGPLTEQFDYTSDAASIFAAIFIISGLIGSFVHAVILDKYK